MDLQRAWLLHSRPYKEQSVIAEFLVENYGRIAMVVRGVRKARSAHTALLQPFNCLLISWKGRSELKTLVSLESSVSMRLTGNALYCGFYVNELLLRALVQGQELEGVTELYQRTITSLGQKEIALEPVLRRFELDLLELCGYLPALSVDAVTGLPLIVGQFYRLQHEAGLFPVIAPARNSHKSLCFPAEQWLALANRDFSQPEFYAGFKRFTRLTLKSLLGGKPLQSRQLFQRNQN